MARTYTESELRAMGISQEQIDSVVEDEEGKGNIVNISNGGLVDRLNKQVREPLRATSISDIKRQASGEFVMLPEFIEGEKFIVKMRRPSLLAMVKQGKIPNSLLSQATELFANGTSTAGQDDNSLEEMMDVVEIICEASLIEPTWKELKDNDIELTDEQLMAIFSYSQRGIKGVEQFRIQ